MHRFNAFALADYTAGGEFHPALKILYEHGYNITDRTVVVKWQILWYDQVEAVGCVDGVSLLGILKLWMTPLAAVSVTSPPMTWFLLISKVA